MALRRGFKTEANEYARDLRAELGLAPHAPLSPWALACHLGIPLMRLSELGASEPAAVRYLTRSAPDVFSAATLFAGYRRLIVYNDAHHPRRQAADLAHEISHGLLGHPPAPILIRAVAAIQPNARGRGELARTGAAGFGRGGALHR